MCRSASGGEHAKAVDPVGVTSDCLRSVITCHAMRGARMVATSTTAYWRQKEVVSYYSTIVCSNGDLGGDCCLVGSHTHAEGNQAVCIIISDFSVDSKNNAPAVFLLTNSSHPSASQKELSLSLNIMTESHNSLLVGTAVSTRTYKKLPTFNL